MIEDLLNRSRARDEREDSHLFSTIAEEGIDLEDTAQHTRPLAPELSALGGSGSLFSGALPKTSRAKTVSSAAAGRNKNGS